MYVGSNLLSAVRFCNRYSIIIIESSVKACNEAKQEKEPIGTILCVYGVGK